MTSTLRTLQKKYGFSRIVTSHGVRSQVVLSGSGFSHDEKQKRSYHFISFSAAGDHHNININRTIDSTERASPSSRLSTTKTKTTIQRRHIISVTPQWNNYILTRSNISCNNTLKFAGLRAFSSDSKRDFYDILGVQRGADKGTIKKAYFKLAKQYHPDTNQVSANIRTTRLCILLYYQNLLKLFHSSHSPFVLSHAIFVVTFMTV